MPIFEIFLSLISLFFLSLSFIQIFEVYREMWADPKVQRFFELPSELRGGKSARTGVASPRKESSPRTDKVVKGATTGTPGEMRKGSGAKTHVRERRKDKHWG